MSEENPLTKESAAPANEPPVQTNEVVFEKAPLSKRLLAFLCDLAVTLVLVALFAWLGSLVLPHLDFYRSAGATFDNLQLNSGLYVSSDSGIVKIEKKYASSEAVIANDAYEKALSSFYSNTLFFETAEKGQEIYRGQKIGNSAIVDSNHETYWTLDSANEVLVKDGVTPAHLNSFYISALNDYGYSYLNNNSDYVHASRILTLSYLFMIPIVVDISLIPVFLVIPLCLHRGKKTLGKAIFKLAVLDRRGLSVRPWHYVLRFLFFLFVEIDLSFFGAGIPLIVSFSMLAFSQRGQSLHDYVCNTYVVDANSQSIYLSEAEYFAAQEKIEKIDIHKPNETF
jgi:uncharacterized RDD family membrane protein YckC